MKEKETMTQIIQFPKIKRKTKEDIVTEITNDIIYSMVEILVKHNLDPSDKRTVKTVCTIVSLLEDVVSIQLGVEKDIQKSVK